MKNHQSYSHGFTLLELIIAIFMFTVITGGVAIFSAYYLQNYSFSFEENQSISQAQTAVTGLVREIREARSGDNGSWPIIEANDTSFIFYSDVTGDNRTDRVRYFLDGTTLKKGIIQPTAVPVSYPTANEAITTIAANVDAGTGPIFRYYNGNWPDDQTNNPLAPANRLLHTRYVIISVTLNISPDYAAQPFKLTSGVMIRSLKDNL